MKNSKFYILVLIVMVFNMNCFAFKGLMNNELKLADEIAKNKKEETNIRGEINTNKKETNIEAETVNTNEKNNAINETENSLLKMKIALNDKTENIKNTAEKIENKTGLMGLDIMYVIIGLSVLSGVILLVMALIIVIIIKARKNKQLEIKYSEKSLLKAAISQIKNRDVQSAIICNDIINQYDTNKMMFNTK